MIFQAWTANNCDCCGNWRLGIVIITSSEFIHNPKEYAREIAENHWKDYSVEIKDFNIETDEWMLINETIIGG